MLFVRSVELKTGMRLAKPIYNKNGVMLYERNSKLTNQGIVSIQNFGLIGVYILEPAEPVPPMSKDDIEFERFQTMSVFTIKEILDVVSKQEEPKGLYAFANQVIKKYGALHHKINFVQNLRSAEDSVYKHALNTAILCAMMSYRMKLEFKKQLEVVVAAILYDVGSLLVPVSMRRENVDDMSEEDKSKLYTYHYAGYQLLNKAYDLDPGARRTAVLACRELYQLHGEEEKTVPEIDEVDILKTAAVFDQMTAMKYGEEPLSEITALRHLQQEENGYRKDVIQALVDSINILQPGVCVELSNGDRGLVIAEGPVNVLEPFVLSFRDNQVLNLSDPHIAREVQIVDIMKTMDNRHVVDKDMLQNYLGQKVHMGEGLRKHHY